MSRTGITRSDLPQSTPGTIYRPLLARSLSMRFQSLLIGVCVLASLCAGRAGAIEWPMLATVEDVPTRVSIRQDFGDGLGWNGGYLQVDSFLPVYQCNDLVCF